MSEINKINRRQAIGGIGAALVVATLAPSSLAGEIGIANSSGSEGLEDPTKKFPQPPFKGQTQPWPGLAGKMDPRPDHGEKIPEKVYSCGKRGNIYFPGSDSIMQ